MSIGRKSFVHHSVQILGREFVSIGENTVIGQDCWLNVNHRHKSVVAIEIGSNCFVGRRNFFSSGLRIRLGDYVLTANDCHFLGSSHIVSDPLRPVISTGTTGEDEIIVGPNCFFGAGVRVVGRVKIGYGSTLGAGSLVNKDIPPFSMAYGSPAVVHKRYSFDRGCWVSSDDFCVKDESSIPSESNYLDVLGKFGAVRMPYIASGGDMGDC